MLPAEGYSARQLADLAATIRAVRVDAVIAATPIDLARLIDTAVPVVRAHYDYADAGHPTLTELVEGRLAEQIGKARRP